MSTTLTAVPGAGAEDKPIVPVSPSPSETTDNSEDAILNRAEEAARTQPAEEPTKPAEETPAVEEKPSDEEKPAEPAPEEEPEPDLEARPELPEGSYHKYGKAQIVGEDGKSTPLFKAFPELRGVIGRHEAYSDLGTISELRDLRTKFPSNEDAEHIVGNSQEFEKWGGEYLDNPAAFLETLQTADQQAFEKLAAELPKFVATQFPEVARRQASQTIESTLRHWQTTAEQARDEELAAAISLVAERAGVNLRFAPPAPSAENSEVSRLRKQLADRENADKIATFKGFASSVESDFTESVLAEIQAQTIKSFPQLQEQGTDAPSVAASKKSDLKDIVREMWQELQDALDNQPQTAAYVKKAYESAKAGRNGANEKKALTDFLVARAKQTLPAIKSRVITKWARRIVADAKKAAPQKIAAPAKESAKAPASAPAPAKPTPRRSEEDILNSLASQLPR